MIVSGHVQGEDNYANDLRSALTMGLEETDEGGECGWCRAAGR